MRLDQKRKRGRVTDEGAECPDIDEGHDPGVLALDDRELVLERGLGRGQIVHEEDGAKQRNGERQHPHQSGVLKVDASDGRRLIEVEKTDTHQNWRQQLDAADADIPASGVQAKRPALHAVGIEERDIGHARGEVAASETSRRGHRQHQPERRFGFADEIGERERRDKQHRRAEDRPVPATERRYRKRVGKSHERADQPGQRHQLKQLVGRVVEAGLRQLGCDDAPDQPDRKSDVLGDDRPDEIAAGDDFALGIPERLILWSPV